MQLPQFTAAAAIYRSSIPYSGTSLRADGPTLGRIEAQQCLPPGLCAKASRCCEDPARGDWCCDILDRCFDCFPF
jgi:hypothetical protein